MQHRAPLAALEDRYGKVGTEIERNERRLGALEGARVEMERERQQIAAQLDTQEKEPTPLFAKLAIASPCPASWDDMRGDNRVRFCGECKKNVYNVSEMTRLEAEELLRKNGDGDMCVRFYERADGTILTQDCPVGVQKKQRRKLALAVIGGTAMWGASIAAAASLVSSIVRGEDEAMPQAQAQVLPPIVPGHLKVSGESGSTVSVDGELAAILPAAAFTLRPGKHTVRIAHPDGTGLEVHEIFVTPAMLIEIAQMPRIPVPVALPPGGRHVAGGIRPAPVPPVKGIQNRF